MKVQQGVERMIAARLLHRSKLSVSDNPGKLFSTIGPPDCRFDGQVPPSIQRELILDAARLRQVDDSVRRIFRSFNRPDHRALTDRSVESVRAALYPKCQLAPVTWRQIEDQRVRIE